MPHDNYGVYLRGDTYVLHEKTFWSGCVSVFEDVMVAKHGGDGLRHMDVLTMRGYKLIIPTEML